MRCADISSAFLSSLRFSPSHQPASGKVLAVAEGSGQHISAFAKEFPGLTYQPTEIEEAAMASIKIYTSDFYIPSPSPAMEFAVFLCDISVWGRTVPRSSLCASPYLRMYPTEGKPSSPA